MKCKNCNTIIQEDDVLFCTNCGVKLEINSSEDIDAGSDIDKDNNTEHIENQSKTGQKEYRKIDKYEKIAMISASSIMLVLIVMVSILMSINAIKDEPPIHSTLFVENGKLNVSTFLGEEKEQLFSGDELTIGEGSNCFFSDDGKYMCYSAKVGGVDTMYFKDITTNGLSVKVDTGIVPSQISENVRMGSHGKNIYYIKGNTLYGFDFKTNRKIADGIKKIIEIDASEKHFVVIGIDEMLYEIEDGKSPAKLGEKFIAVSRLVPMSIKYQRDGVNYIKFLGSAHTESVDDDLYKFVNDTGKFYSETASTNISIEKIFEDDLIESDKTKKDNNIDDHVIVGEVNLKEIMDKNFWDYMSHSGYYESDLRSTYESEYKQIYSDFYDFCYDKVAGQPSGNGILMDYLTKEAPHIYGGDLDGAFGNYMDLGFTTKDVAVGDMKEYIDEKVENVLGFFKDKDTGKYYIIKAYGEKYHGAMNPNRSEYYNNFHGKVREAIKGAQIWIDTNVLYGAGAKRNDFFHEGYYSQSESKEYFYADRRGKYAVYLANSVDSLPKMKMSQFVDYYYKLPNYLQGSDKETINQHIADLYQSIYLANSGQPSVYLSDGVWNKKLIAEKPSRFHIKDALGGDELYYMENYNDETKTGTLMKANVKYIDGIQNLSEPLKGEVVSEAVSDYAFSLSGEVVYFTDVKDNHGKLYKDGTLVDENVYIHSVINHLRGLSYLTEYKDRMGTLKFYKDGQSTQVDVNVNVTMEAPNGIAYYKNYNMASGIGELYLYSPGGEMKLISKESSEFWTNTRGDAKDKLPDNVLAADLMTGAKDYLDGYEINAVTLDRFWIKTNDVSSKWGK